MSTTTTKKARTKKPATVTHDRPLLEPVEGVVLPGRTVRGWRFTRTPKHFMYTDIKPGSILLNEPAPTDKRFGTWSIMEPLGYSFRSLGEDVAVQYLMIAAVEKDVIQQTANGDKPAYYRARQFTEYAAAAAAGEV